jgi:hypothetical protein
MNVMSKSLASKTLIFDLLEFIYSTMGSIALASEAVVPSLLSTNVALASLIRFPWEFRLTIQPI